MGDVEPVKPTSLEETPFKLVEEVKDLKQLAAKLQSVNEFALSLSASKLLDRDITSKSDPMTVVYVKKRDETLEEIGRTEVIMNNLNPSWIEKISIAYQFEILQLVVFHVYDVDTKYHNLPVKMLKLKDQDFLGEASCALSEIITKPSRTLTTKLGNKNRPGVPRNLGTLSVHSEETVASKSAVEIALRCSRLENVDLFSKRDPFLRISRIVENGDPVPICKTEVINNNLNPIWRPLTLSIQQFGSTASLLLSYINIKNRRMFGARRNLSL